MPRMEQSGSDVLLWIKAVPGASRDQIAGVLGERLKIRISAPPEAGKANAAILALLARSLNIKISGITVESGHGHPEKTLRFRNVDVARLSALLSSVLE